MDATQFAEHTQGDAQVVELARDIAARMETDGASPGERQYAFGVDDALIGLAVYVLWRWSKDTFDHQRARNETEIAEQRVRLVRSLISDGFEPGQAAKATQALLAQIAKRTEDDAAIQKAIGLLAGPKS